MSVTLPLHPAPRRRDFLAAGALLDEWYRFTSPASPS